MYAYRGPNLRQQRGQALVLAVLLTGVAAVAIYMGYNIARISSTKIRIMHASDNAAYSAAVYQARVMNYMAYINRAMITNHVTAAQAVTAAGYTQYQSTNTTNLCTAFCWVPYLGHVLKGLDQVVERTDTAVQAGSLTIIHGVNAMNFALQLSQQAVWLAAESKMPAVVREVARANHPEAQVIELPLMRTVASYFQWTKRYETESERWRFGRTVQNSRDSWTARRNNDGLKWLKYSVLGNAFVRDFRFSKRGGTELSDLKRWESTDTLSLKFKTPSWRGRLRWRDGERPPLGWGSSNSGTGDINRSKNAYGRSGSVNPDSTRYAWNAQRELRAKYQGIGPFVDLQDKQRGKSLEVVAEVFVSQDHAGTAIAQSGSVRAGPQIRTKDQLVGRRISSSSKAKTYFERPVARSDGSTELASTFNPYWQARLITLSRDDMLLNDMISGRHLITLTPYY